MSILIPSYQSHELQYNPHHAQQADCRIVVNCSDDGACSDGYHTFDELYEHRCLLFLAFLRHHQPVDIQWKSRKHHDGSQYDNWFMVGTDVDGVQISYHLPDSMWGLAWFLPEYECAPREWDGHSSQDVCDRLRRWILDRSLETLNFGYIQG